MILLIFFLSLLKLKVLADNHVLGCGGFIKSPEVQIDLSNLEIKLSTKQGILKDKTNCAPKNGYYFLPVYDHGEYVIEVNPPKGWSFTPKKFEVNIDGKSDVCSKGIDINFLFEGFGINGRVESLGDPLSGPEGITVELKGKNKNVLTKTTKDGVFLFKPVYPGEYTISASHDRFKFVKNSISVKVTQSTVNLPPNSLVIYGYKLTGFVKSYNEPLFDVIVKLYKHAENNVKGIEGSNNKFPKECPQTKDILCFTKTDKNGMFTFENVPSGKYYLEPYCLNKYIDYQPKMIEFEIKSSDLVLEENFEVIGFIVYGKIVDGKDGLSDAEVHLNNQFISKTDKNGQFKLGKLKTGEYHLKINKENYHFNERVVKVDPNIHILTDISPDGYKICGKIDTVENQKISIKDLNNKLNRISETKNGEFCEILPKGVYSAEILETENLRFYPRKQKFEVIGPNSNALTFSQLRATLTGKIQCLSSKDCTNLKVILTSLDSTDVVVQPVVQNGYKFSDLTAGSYEIKLAQNKLCWRDSSFSILIKDVMVTAPAFVQNGYSVSFVSSHDTTVSYKVTDNIEVLQIVKGKNIYCLPKNGSYIFDHEGCHEYASKSLMYNTQVEPNEVHLNALKHSNKVCISAKKNFGTVTLSIETETGKTIEPLSFKDGCFSASIKLKPNEEATLVPKSEVFYFEPSISKVKGGDDCSDLGVVFKAYKGHSFKGKINPALKDVEIVLQIDDKELITHSDDKGKYEFPPVNLESENYRITAKMESFHFTGPDDNGVITAHKLAEIIVSVVDGSDNLPLQGALVSLSGSESYRSNLQTDSQGKIAFKSLSSSEYYLRPMMKEYSFNPPSKILNIKEGQVLEVTLIGKRVAFSAFGTVTSLNGHPQPGVNVQAEGVNNCSSYSEESTTDPKGAFRVRGLQPYCSYKLTAKLNGDEKSKRCIPKYIEINGVNDDVRNINMIVYTLPEQMQTTVKVYSSQSEYYKMLALKVYQKQLSSSSISSIKVNGPSVKITDKFNKGVIIYLPPLPNDGKTYVLQLEPISTIQNVKWVAPSVSIVANSSFKYAELEFIINNNRTVNYVNQVSSWTLVFITMSLVILYNIKYVIGLVDTNFDFNLSNFSGIFKRSTITTYKNNTDIDQLVQSINAVKKKVKAKKI